MTTFRRWAVEIYCGCFILSAVFAYTSTLAAIHEHRAATHAVLFFVIAMVVFLLAAGFAADVRQRLRR